MKLYNDRVEHRQTHMRLVCDSEQGLSNARTAVMVARTELEAFIMRDDFFYTTMEPYEFRGGSMGADDAPRIVRDMIHSSAQFGIGPMGAVAGTISDIALEAMKNDRAAHAVAENGGDIAIIPGKDTTVGLFAGASGIRDIAFKLKQGSGRLGICTSSGTVGHSISLGTADAAIVIGETASLADAAATALCNSVKHADKGHLSGCFEIVKKDGIHGAMIIVGETVAKWGELPEIIKLDGIEPELVAGYRLG